MTKINDKPLMKKRLNEVNTNDLKTLNNIWNKYMCHSLEHLDKRDQSKLDPNSFTDEDRLYKSHSYPNVIIKLYSEYVFEKNLRELLSFGNLINNKKNLIGKSLSYMFDERRGSVYQSYCEDSYFKNYEDEMTVYRFNVEYKFEEFELYKNLLSKVNDTNIIEVKREFETQSKILFSKYIDKCEPIWERISIRSGFTNTICNK